MIKPGREHKRIRHLKWTSAGFQEAKNWLSVAMAFPNPNKWEFTVHPCITVRSDRLQSARTATETTPTLFRSVLSESLEEINKETARVKQRKRWKEEEEKEEEEGR